MKVTSRAHQTGIAALTAILVVAIATVLAVNLLWQSSVDLRRTETLLLQDQARQYDLGGEEFAKFGLAEDFRDDRSEGNDTYQENWAKPLVFDVEAGKLKGFLRDQQGRFDLNGLIDKVGKRVPAAADQYQRLLILLPLERPLDPGTAAALVDATVDWIDPDQSPEPINGAEDDQYTSRQPPYRPADFWFTSTSELLAIEGYTPEIYQKLQAHVTALPPPQGNDDLWKLNVNTATDLVLASLAPNLGPQDVEPFLNGAYENEGDFVEDFRTVADIQPQSLGVKSSWFLLTVTATIGTAQSTMYSLLERDGEVIHTRLRSFDAN